MSASQENCLVESCGREYKVSRLKDFIAFRDFALAKDNSWTEAFDDKKGMFVESRPEEVPPGEKPTGINIVRVNFDMPTVDPEILYDSLHDSEYRKSWDHNMLVGKNICVLDHRNDIGYYAAETPSRFVSKRDFCNMRSWMEFSNGDFLIMNHSEPHADCPEAKGFVRANSINTGYYVIPVGKGCRMVYVSHTDIKGSIPAWIMNTLMTKMAPKAMRNLESCALKYPEWAQKHHSLDFVGKWRTPKCAWDGSLGNGGEEAESRSSPAVDKSLATDSEAGSPMQDTTPTKDKEASEEEDDAEKKEKEGKSEETLVKEE